MGKTIGIISGKGGVGKTTLAINLGLAIHHFGEDVTVIDGDIKNPSIGLYLGMHPSVTINSILKGDENINDAVRCLGLKVIPASLAVNAVDLTKIKDILNNLNGYKIIDFPPGLDKDMISLLSACDEVIIVTNPNILSVASTLRIIDVIKNLDKNILGIAMNMTGKSYEISKNELEIVCSLPIWEIPEDENVRKSIMLKTPVVLYRPYSKASISFKELAARILDMKYSPPRFSVIRNIIG